jgi:hypothetical protein
VPLGCTGTGHCRDPPKPRSGVVLQVPCSKNPGPGGLTIASSENGLLGLVWDWECEYEDESWTYYTFVFVFVFAHLTSAKVLVV